MEPNNVSLFAPNLVCSCVDDVKFGRITGRLFLSNVREPFIFTDIDQMVLRMDRYFDEIRFPMASTESRSFHRTKPNTERKEGVKRMQDMSILNHKGDKATFIIQIQYRQNATWQGKIVWADQNKTQYFRSALEMMKLIDSALSEGAVMAQQFEYEAGNHHATREMG